MKLKEVTKKRVVEEVNISKDDFIAQMQQRLQPSNFDYMVNWMNDDFNGDHDAFIQAAATERDDFWQMPRARDIREKIFAVNTGAGRRDNTPTGDTPVVPLDTVISQDTNTPRGRGDGNAEVNQRRRDRNAADDDAVMAQPVNTTPDPDANDSRERDQRNTPATDPTPATQDPTAAEEPPAEPVTPPTRPGQETSGANFDEITSNLRRGSRGEGVRALQQRLGINADGIFGPATEQAVRAFQQENNLQVDGVVGRQTLAALQGGEAQQPGRIGNAPATTAPATSPAPQERPVDPQAAAAVARTDNIGRRRIGTDAGDGLVWIVGNTNALTRVRPNDPRVAAQRAAVANAPSAGSVAPGPISTAPTTSPRPQARPQQNASKENKGNALIESTRIATLAGVNMKKQLNEASVNFNGSAEEIADLMRMMQLAGAPDAKPVDAMDISQGPKPCSICGKIHGPMPKPGGCGGAPMQGPQEPDMGDMIRMISKEEENEDGGFGDATTEPDEYTGSNAGDVSDVIPSGDDLHKEKGSYPATAGGDNPMNTTESIKASLLKALAEKKAKPDFLDVDKDGDKKEPMKKALKDKKKKPVGEAAKPDFADLDKDGDKIELALRVHEDATPKLRTHANNLNKHIPDNKRSGEFVKIMATKYAAKYSIDADDLFDTYVAMFNVHQPQSPFLKNTDEGINNLGRKMIDMSSKISGTDDNSLMMANALSRLGEVLAEFGGNGFAANNMNDVIKKTGMSKQIVQMLMKKAKSDNGADSSPE